MDRPLSTRPAAATRVAAGLRRLSRRPLGRLAFARRRGVVASRGARRWAVWARALAARFLAGRSRMARAALVFQRRAAQSAGFAERIVERTLARTTLFAPRLQLTIAPLARRAGQAGAQATVAGSTPRRLALPRGTAASRASTALPAPRGDRAQPRDGGPAPSAREGTQAAHHTPRSSRAVDLALARSRRLLPETGATERAPLVHRVAAQRRRVEIAAPRPAITLHRATAPAAPAEAAAERSARPRRARAGSSAAAATLSAAAPALLSGAPGELDRLTEQVVRRIDRRMAAWRERTGRVR